VIETRNMSAEMRLQTASGNTHEREGRGVSFNARRSKSLISKPYRSTKLLEMLTFPCEIIEHQNRSNVAGKKYHKVRVVFHADWSYDECSNNITRGICGHTAIQHPR
jgi:hypothetical protein